VSSSSNARVKAAKQLHSSNGRKKTGLVLLEGLRLCCDALEASFVEDSAVPAPTSVLVDLSAFDSPEGARLEAALQVGAIFSLSISFQYRFLFQSRPMVTHLRFSLDILAAALGNSSNSNRRDACRGRHYGFATRCCAHHVAADVTVEP